MYLNKMELYEDSLHTEIKAITEEIDRLAYKGGIGFFVTLTYHRLADKRTNLGQKLYELNLNN